MGKAVSLIQSPWSLSVFEARQEALHVQHRLWLAERVSRDK